MSRKKILWVNLLLILSSFGFTKEKFEEIVITSHASAYPLLRGLPSNPQLRLTIIIPAGSAEINYRKIKCTLDPEALRMIQKMDMFMPKTETFSTVNDMATIDPNSKAFDIPVYTRLQPGTYNLWVSVVLKENADINKVVELHCTKMTDADSQLKSITESELFYKKLIGIAIRKPGENRVNTCRIPGLITTNKETPIDVYDIRYDNSAYLPANIDVGMNRSTDGGKTLASMNVSIDLGVPHGQKGIGDPSILIDPATKKIWEAALWSKVNYPVKGSGPGLSPDESGQFILAYNSDDGLTWALLINITSQVRDPEWIMFFQGPGSGINMKDGKIVFHAQYWDAAKKPYSSLINISDHGDTWQRGSTGAKSNTIESQLAETTPGTLMLNIRYIRGGFRCVSTTTNTGTTWSEHQSSYNTLIDPVCMGTI